MRRWSASDEEASKEGCTVGQAWQRHQRGAVEPRGFGFALTFFGFALTFLV
jgi:hypothetical protein